MILSGLARTALVVVVVCYLLGRIAAGVTADGLSVETAFYAIPVAAGLEYLISVWPSLWLGDTGRA